MRNNTKSPPPPKNKMLAHTMNDCSPCISMKIPIATNTKHTAIKAMFFQIEWYILISSINSDLSGCKSTNFLRLFLQKLCQTYFSFQRLTLLTASMYLFSIHKNQIPFWLRDEQPLETRFLAHISSFPFFNHRTYPWRTKEGRKCVCHHSTFWGYGAWTICEKLT